MDVVPLPMSERMLSSKNVAPCSLAKSRISSVVLPSDIMRRRSLSISII